MAHGASPYISSIQNCSVVWNSKWSLVSVCIELPGLGSNKTSYCNRFRDTKRKAISVGMGLTKEKYVFTRTIWIYLTEIEFLLPLDCSGKPVTQMAMVRMFSRNVQRSGSEIATCQWMNTVIDNWIDHQPFLTTDEYKTTYGSHGGCEKSLPPPSTEDKICESFHEKISQLKNTSQGELINDDHVKAFLETPTESLLIPTDEIRFGRFFFRPQF